VCRDEGIPTASLWANVPHYVSGIENPKAALALIRRVLLLINAEADLSELSEAAKQFEQNLNGVVAQNAKISEYVAKLERKKSEEDEDAGRPDELPPSGDLVAEIEQFLRQQRPEGT
jgi:proteasome assembly chaperone (PAC2) family protein